jgi:type IV pilus assembly protein PilM
MGMRQRLFLHDKPLAGIDISQTGIKVMAIDPKKWTVFGYGSVDLDPTKLQESLTTNNDYLANAIESLMSNHITGHIPSNHVVISVPTSRTYSRNIVLPREAEKNLLEAIQLEAEQYIPVPITELNVGYEIIERTDKELVVTISAAPSALVEALVKACEASGLVVLMVEPGINSIARLINHAEEGHLPTVLVDIGAATTDIAILDDTVRASSSVNEGGNSFTLKISERLNVTLEKAHQLKVLEGLGYGPKQAKITTALKPSLDEIIDKIEKIMRFYTERIDSKNKLSQVVIVGGGSNVPGLGEYFTDALVMPARVASPWQLLDFGKLPQPVRQYKPRYITAAGLACVPPREVLR